MDMFAFVWMNRERRYMINNVLSLERGDDHEKKHLKQVMKRKHKVREGEFDNTVA